MSKGFSHCARLQKRLKELSEHTLLSLCPEFRYIVGLGNNPRNCISNELPLCFLSGQCTLKITEKKEQDSYSNSTKWLAPWPASHPGNIVKGGEKAHMWPVIGHLCKLVFCVLPLSLCYFV